MSQEGLLNTLHYIAHSFLVLQMLAKKKATVAPSGRESRRRVIRYACNIDMNIFVQRILDSKKERK